METPLRPAPGSPATVTLAGGRLARVRVTGLVGDTVYVTSEAAYRRAKEAGEEPEPLLGFPGADVRATADEG